MKKLYLLLFVLIHGCAGNWAPRADWADYHGPVLSSHHNRNVSHNTRLHLNAYGPGIGMDQTGRTFHHDPNTQIRQNTYGPGVHMDQTGSAVQVR